MAVIQPLPRELAGRAAITLGRAFSSDPMFQWLFPEPLQRSRSLTILNRVPIDYGMRRGRVTHSEEGRAIAIWFPPGRPVTVGGMISTGILGVPFRIGFRPFGRFMSANGVMERIHKREMPEPHWYLLIVGVDPELQGRGLGSELVRDGLARADETDSPCYLETSDERNLAFYQRLGFRVLEKVTLGGGGPAGWAMRRDSRSAGA